MAKAWFVLMALLHFSGQSFGYQKDTSQIKRRNATLMAVPTLGSAPETGFYFGAVALADFKPSPDSLSKHSVLKTELSYTLKRQFIASAEWTLWQKKGRWMVQGQNSWMRFPERFWGFGGNTKPEDDFLYDAFRLELANTFYLRISKKSNWFWGLCQQFQSVYRTRYIDDYPIEKQALVNPFSSVRPGISSGLGMGLLQDTRSNLLNPGAGEMFASVQCLGFLPAFGSGFTFGTLDADLRIYRKLPVKGLAAFQLISRHRTKDSPYRMQGMLGGPMMLRGYYFGRYRDLNYSAAQAEYRYSGIRRLGFTAFAAAGQVYRFGEATDAGQWKWAGGLGFRFRVDKQEGTCLRMDMAMSGEGDFGFYFSFGEAF